MGTEIETTNDLLEKWEYSERRAEGPKHSLGEYDSKRAKIGEPTRRDHWMGEKTRLMGCKRSQRILKKTETGNNIKCRIVGHQVSSIK